MNLSTKVMSQNVANTGLPTPAATQDWTTILEEAIQLASDNDKETADVKYAKHQCWKQVRKEHKVAKEVAAHEKVEAEHLEDNWEMNRQSKMPVETRLRTSAPTGDRPGTSVLVLAQSGSPGPAESSKAKGKAKARDPVPVGPCAQCVRARVECTFELARASAEKKKKASDKKKWARAKGPEVEVQAGSSRSEGVGGEMLIAWGLHAIVAAIDQHTSEMAKHREITKQTQHVQRQLNSRLYDLLQETEYQRRDEWWGD
ncbi:hypothetical protein EDC04DRAFT_2599651 [Pisolithus marmoratus]|nr:hypothetical protein EDC04DRAFT_2599651 [Pisolithus marmoratus]